MLHVFRTKTPRKRPQPCLNARDFTDKSAWVRVCDFKRLKRLTNRAPTVQKREFCGRLGPREARNLHVFRTFMVEIGQKSADILGHFQRPRMWVPLPLSGVL